MGGSLSRSLLSLPAYLLFPGVKNLLATDGPAQPLIGGAVEGAGACVRRGRERGVRKRFSFFSCLARKRGRSRLCGCMPGRDDGPGAPRGALAKSSWFLSQPTGWPGLAGDARLRAWERQAFPPTSLAAAYFFRSLIITTHQCRPPLSKCSMQPARVRLLAPWAPCEARARRRISGATHGGAKARLQEWRGKCSRHVSNAFP